MKKLLFAALSVSLALVSCADEPKKPYDPAKDKPTTPEEVALRKAWVAERRYKHFGGDLLVKGTLAGEIAVVNCQKSADSTILNESIAYLKKETKFNITLKDGTFQFPKPEIIGNASLFVVDDPSLPSMLLAPENRWAVINIAPLKAGRGEKPAFFKARILKEMSRTFAGLCGGISSNYPGSLTTGIYSVERLDQEEDQRLSVDVISRFAPSLEPIGIKPAVYASYRQACKEGWAPSPTNDVQKAIWDEIRSVPDKPLKIEFDPKQGK